jgi:hypothetical protein
MAKKKKEETAWLKAKEILLKEYLEGKITDAMKPSFVYTLRPEFEAVKYENFRNNFRTMKNNVGEK